MPRHPFSTLHDAATLLESGQTTAIALVEEALARAGEGEGPRAFTALHAKSARNCALAMDALRKVGRAPSRFAGIPVTVKDLFDERGHVTRAGSRALEGEAARETAPAVARLQRHGFVVLGRTNMSEFAFSGLGLNPHFGTPLAPWDRPTGRVPGGSSSGAAVAAADGMGFGGLGTDTGGSCRIPAALCGVVGFKPTAARVPLDGAFPLSASLDSIGPIARAVRDCHALDAVIAGAETVPMLPEVEVAGLRLGVLSNYVEAEMEGEVARAYARALARLEAAGARLTDLALPEIERIPEINAKGGLTAAEAMGVHGAIIEAGEDRYDPFILGRIRRHRIHRRAARAGGDGRRLRAAHRRLRRGDLPDRAAAAAEPRCRSRRGGGDAGQRAAAAQHHGGELPRPLRHLHPMPRGGRRPGRPHADGRAHGRCAAAGDRRGGRARPVTPRPFSA